MIPEGRKSRPALYNFGRNICFRPRDHFGPETETELLSVLTGIQGRTLRVMGSLHSWSPLVATDDVVVSMEAFDRIEIHADGPRPFVRVGGGCTLERLLRQLRSSGFTLPTLGIIARQTVAGAISTGTHGSGTPCLSAYVRRVRIAHPDPDSGEPVVSVMDSGEDLRAAQCALGCLGGVTEVDLDIRPGFRIEEHFRSFTSLGDVLKAESTYPLQQIFWFPWSWTYQAQHRKETQAPHSRLRRPYRWYRFFQIDLGFHLVVSILVRILGSRKLIHLFYRGAAPRTLIRGLKIVDDAERHLLARHDGFRHMEMELFIRRSHLERAIDRIRELLVSADRGEPAPSAAGEESVPAAPCRYTHHYPICIRRVKPDTSHLSMAQGGTEDFYAISLMTYDVSDSGKKQFLEIMGWLARILMREVDARCHWGKVNPSSAEDIARLYPEVSAFQACRQRCDKEGIFLNPALAKMFAPQIPPEPSE